MSRESILRTVAGFGDGALDKSLWEATAEEVKKGGLEGLIDVSELVAYWLKASRGKPHRSDLKAKCWAGYV